MVLRSCKKFWRTKLPLKVKAFLWFLKKRVILNEDNLTRRNQNGSKLCCLCSNIESIHHLFFECYHARFLWRALHIVFGLVPPVSVEYLFNGWHKQGGNKYNPLLLSGAFAFCLSIWLTRNGKVLNNYQPKMYLQVLFRGHIGYAFGPNCSEVTKKKIASYMHVAHWI